MNDALKKLAFRHWILNLMRLRCLCGAFVEYYSVNKGQRICSVCCLKRINTPTLLQRRERILGSSIQVPDHSNDEDSENDEDNEYGKDVGLGNQKYDRLSNDSKDQQLVNEFAFQTDTNESKFEVIPFLNNNFSKVTHIIVDDGCDKRITYLEAEKFKFPLFTNCLDNALLFHKPGWSIQIQRQWFALKR